ncbi:methyltransferase domain-containing protein [Roseiconus nitratireducens]|uniref:Methyltransferase domain-containing protein n=1 Tax=Roseiconus nitratireducens TaxID=2605748 RepID=A0A5M6CYI7_9BACT|nr:methyltransferase [Roseiconus nitratireducens]KAA5540284.1 methyltransferase domain-containing protein [Roseiconus nitratireducens]
MKTDLSKNPHTDPALLLRYRDRQYAADMLAVAIGKLNLFTWIDRQGQVDTSAIAAEFGLAARPLDVLLTLCRASGLVRTDPETQQHRLTPLASEYLVEGSPWFLRPYYAPIVDSAIAQGCLQVLQHDRPANWQAKDDGSDWHESMMDEGFAKSFTDLMNCRGTAMGQVLADTVAPLIADVSHLLDVGGGSGIYSSTMVAKHPHLRATVLEQQPVDRLARQEVARHGLEEQIDVITADMFRDAWPSPTDCVLLSNVLHDWDFPEIRQLIQRASDVLPAGGHLLIHETFLEDDKSGPLPVAEYSVLLVNITRGKCYSAAEYREILEQFGFAVGPCRPTLSDRGVLTAKKR